MILTINPYHFDDKLWLLWVTILIFAIVSLLLFVLTIIKRIRSIRREKTKKRYQEIINPLLFNYLFESKDLNSTIELYNKYFHIAGPLFARLTIKSLLQLNRVYKGDYQNNIASFFNKSGLAEYSLELLESRSWVLKIEGIRNLSELSSTDSFQEIKTQLSNQNKMVQEEAIIGMIRLRGLNVLSEIKNSPLFLNDWFQAHVFHTIKINNFDELSNYPSLLESENLTFQLLIARIAEYFNNTEVIDKLIDIESESDDLRIKSQINLVIEKLQTYKTQLE